MKNLGNAIKNFRKERKISRIDFAAKAGISTPYLSQIEHSNKTPNIETLSRISEALDVPLSILIFRATGEEDISDNDKKALFLEIKPLFDDVVNDFYFSKEENNAEPALNGVKFSKEEEFQAAKEDLIKLFKKGLQPEAENVHWFKKSESQVVREELIQTMKSELKVVREELIQTMKSELKVVREELIQTMKSELKVVIVNESKDNESTIVNSFLKPMALWQPEGKVFNFSAQCELDDKIRIEVPIITGKKHPFIPNAGYKVNIVESSVEDIKNLKKKKNEKLSVSDNLK